jgi:ADP-ribosylglycohydrolase
MDESESLPALFDEAAVGRAAGVLMGLGVGDALGVPYEFDDVRAASAHPPEMLGGGLGPYAPGEYSDDTQMAVCIAGVMASGKDPCSREVLDGIGAAFLRWAAEGASDIGNVTRRVLTTAANSSGFPASNLSSIAAQDYREHDQSAGNGALMRTAPVALFGLALIDADESDRSERRQTVARAARLIAELTHADPRE